MLSEYSCEKMLKSYRYWSLDPASHIDTCLILANMPSLCQLRIVGDQINIQVDSISNN